MLTYAVLAVGLSAAAWHYGVWSWLRTRPARLRLAGSLLKGLYNGWQRSEQAALPVAFTVCDTDCSAMVTYTRFGKSETVLLPYSRKQANNMQAYVAVLERERHEPLVITQQPGIPYLVTAGQLGGTAIVITNTETQQEVRYVERAPGYAEELIYQE